MYSEKKLRGENSTQMYFITIRILPEIIIRSALQVCAITLPVSTSKPGVMAELDFPLSMPPCGNSRAWAHVAHNTRMSAADAPGMLSEAAGDRLVVATGAGRLQLLVIQAEGKRPMGAREFLAGHPLTQGDRFTAVP